MFGELIDLGFVNQMRHRNPSRVEHCKASVARQEDVPDHAIPHHTIDTRLALC